VSLDSVYEYAQHAHARCTLLMHGDTIPLRSALSNAPRGPVVRDRCPCGMWVEEPKYLHALLALAAGNSLPELQRSQSTGSPK